MRKGITKSPLSQFSSYVEYQNDNSDGGRIPVFTFRPISHFGKRSYLVDVNFDDIECLNRGFCL